MPNKKEPAMIKLYSNGCPNCVRTGKIFDKKGVPYETVKVDDATAGRLRSKGHRQLPVVESPVGTWDGMRPDKILEAAQHDHAQAGVLGMMDGPAIA